MCPSDALVDSDGRGMGCMSAACSLFSNVHIADYCLLVSQSDLSLKASVHQTLLVISNRWCTPSFNRETKDIELR